MSNDLERVRGLLPPDLDFAAPDVEPVDATPLRQAAILERVLSGPRSRERPTTRRPRRRAPVALAMLTIAALAVLAGVRVADRSALAALPIRAAVTARTADAGSSPNPRALLLTAARHARAERATPPPGRPVRYQRTMAAYLHTVGGATPASVLAPERTESWATPDGSGEIRHSAAAVIWPSAEDRNRWGAGGAPLGRSRTDHFADIDPISRNRSSDPSVLARQVRAPTTGSPQDAVAWTMAAIRDIVNAETASPALRGAALEVAARLPLTSFGPVRDQLARPGYALGIDSAYSGARTRYEWIVSRSGALLEYQQLLLEPAHFVHGRLPLQIEFEIQSVRAWVARVGSTPGSASSS